MMTTDDLLAVDRMDQRRKWIDNLCEDQRREWIDNLCARVSKLKEENLYLRCELRAALIRQNALLSDMLPDIVECDKE